MKYTRNYTFTWNNYPKEAEEHLRSLKSVKYCVAGREVGDNGTPHLQGTIVFQFVKTHHQAIKLLPGCHVEQCKALHASVEYCKKDGDLIEFGTPPKKPKQIGEDENARWQRIRQACEEDRLEDIEDSVRWKHYKHCEYFRAKGAMHLKLPDTEEQHLWYWGDAGTGKSRKARDQPDEVYLKTSNKWWDGYDGQRVVVVEDLDRRHEKLAHHIKKWADRYAFMAEIKGGAMKIRPPVIIVTSNYHPRDIWTHKNDLEPILRRFKFVEFKAFPKKRKREEIYLPNTHDP